MAMTKSLEKKTAVVTGASSGIGWASVARMIGAGWRLFATVRKGEDASKLTSKFGTGVPPVIVDLTNRGAIRAAADEVAAQLAGRGLDGLVNVAGVGMARPIEYVTAD